MSPDAIVPERDSSADPGPDPVDVVAAAVLGTVGVAALHGGDFGEIATYLPGRRVNGIRIGSESCAVHITAEYPADLIAVADAVRARVEPLVGMPVHVTIEDLQDPRQSDRKQVAP
ncbi:Asp23/Gls24 family envelope stress response protein [Rhodococcus chondri]|uniref:Asp23/Gls24 family envelope stress response protein n=1 Tax=Rhodococcus chondri TaxID=3065941 RepID=A0ABU7JTD2_9NOCA|nr:hypothetical protein [Rhodococcus sp. CC-R104]MEE2033286.1 hypothetical protein [Rhodococcus sp. CC-R104]